jgi:paraquat-inducible protein B
VLIEVDPALMRPVVSPGAAGPDAGFIRQAVTDGLRAALKTGSLITGALYVDLDYYQDAVPAEMGSEGEYLTIPTISTGLAQLEAKITAILDKLQGLPLDKTVAGISAAADEAKVALQEIKATAAAARETLEDPEFRGLPGDLRESIATLEQSIASVGPGGAVHGDLLRTLDELRASLRSLKSVATTIDEKPNSLLFGRESSGNPKPKAPR